MKSKMEQNGLTEHFSSGPPEETDWPYLSDYEEKRKTAKEITDDIYPNTVRLDGKGYCFPPNNPQHFSSKDCRLTDDWYKCTVCGVKKRYCTEHEGIHCGCTEEWQDGRRLSPPIHFLFYSPGNCRRDVLVPKDKQMMCSVCGAVKPYCRTHKRLHCGCEESASKWG